MPRVFLITGCSTGFGYHLVNTVLANNDICVATARKPDSLSFDQNLIKSSNFLALPLDVLDNASIDAAFAKTIEKFGRVDVVVNNAGYGLSGPFEELEENMMRKQMEVNFWGLTAVTRKAVEVMREQKPSGGLIQQVTSIGGQKGYVSWVLIHRNMCDMMNVALICNRQGYRSSPSTAHRNMPSKASPKRSRKRSSRSGTSNSHVWSLVDSERIGPGGRWNLQRRGTRLTIIWMPRRP